MGGRVRGKWVAGTGERVMSLINVARCSLWKENQQGSEMEFGWRPFLTAVTNPYLGLNKHEGLCCVFQHCIPAIAN